MPVSVSHNPSDRLIRTKTAASPQSGLNPLLIESCDYRRQSSPGTQFIGVARVFACSHSLISARSNQRPLCRPGQLLRLSASGYWAKTEVPKIVFDG